MAEVGKAFATKQGPIERVVYLSAKAIYLDPLSAEVKTSTGTDFGDALELFQAILMLADWSSDDQVSQYDYETALNSLEELLDTETIFIVVDDIDTLTTANKDGGMEEMFLLMSRAKSGSKILYTQRNFPSFAPRAAVEVPGLDHEEAHQFIDLCCKKFSVPAPSDNEEKWIKENSEKRPLAIETMIGMRRITASYSDAFQRWKERSGDARSYLFSREYQQLNHNDRGRHLLAALSISDAPQSFGALQSVLQFTTEQLEDAIAETRDMFLSITSGNDAEGDLYSIGPATRLYVSEVSKQLDRFGAIKARVTHLRNISASTPKAFAHIIDGAARSVDAGQPEKAITMLTNPSLPDVFKEHPLVNAVLGKAYAEVHPPNVIEARACFESAFSLGHRNYQMYIDWLDLEQKNRTEVLNGLAICEKVTSANGFTPRTKATFFKRKARLQVLRAKEIELSSPEESAKLRTESLLSNLEAYRIARSINDKNIRLFFEKADEAIRINFQRTLRSASPFAFVESFEVIASQPVQLDGFAQTLARGIEDFASAFEHNEKALQSQLARLRGRISQLETNRLSQAVQKNLLDVLKRVSR